MVPTLLLAGECSPPVIAEINDTLFTLLPEAQRIDLPGASHMAPITHPQATADALTAFLHTL